MQKNVFVLSKDFPLMGYKFHTKQGGKYKEYKFYVGTMHSHYLVHNRAKVQLQFYEEGLFDFISIRLNLKANS